MDERVSHVSVGAWAVREVASYHLARIAAAFAQADVDTMVLKGMWLQGYAYSDPDERPFADLDLLIGREQLGRAHALLLGAGYRLLLAAPGDAARLYVAPKGFQVDLHVELFPDGLYGLRGAHLLARGRVDHSLAGVPVLVPEPYDGFAHLVGHFAKGRHGPWDVKRVRDFDEVGRAFALDPQRAAEHLVAHGLRRAGLYALQFASHPDSFAARTRRALPADARGRGLVRALGLPRPLTEPQRLRDRLFPFALSHDVVEGLGACGRRARALVREGGARRLLTPRATPHPEVTP